MGNAIKILLLENIMSKLYAIKTVYHGTTSNYTEQILRRINIKRGSLWADFGPIPGSFSKASINLLTALAIFIK